MTDSRTRNAVDERLLALPWVTLVERRRPCEGIRWSRVPLGGPIPASAHCSRRARYRYEVTPAAAITDGVSTGHYCWHHAQGVAFGGNVERARIEKRERQVRAAAHARASKRRNRIAAVPDAVEAPAERPEPVTVSA
jgi:hypothetical protein